MAAHLNVTRALIAILSALTLFLYHDYTRREIFFNIFIENKLVNFTGAEDFIPPFINIVSDLFVAPDYGIAACGIRKSMSQLTINTMCLLYDAETFDKEGQSLNDTWKTQGACNYDDPKFRKIPELHENFTKIAFIRNPFDRFISFYLDKCLREKQCWRCDSNMECVVETLYKQLQRFKIHRDYTPNYIEMHAAPLSWNCDFDSEIQNYNLFMMGADVEERRSSILHLANVLTSKNVPKSLIDKIVSGSLNGETDHGTHKSVKRLEAENMIRENSRIRDLLHKIYLYDYLIFNFNRNVLDAKYQTDFWNNNLL
ncbi:unnamed protein product [Caenorhabditis angaria]|uniref:Sulfotransferase domain-containing protein n=1 Tax=Caenorhabditis angaria TaxID=860376 RepID=A0A9P1IYD7_9PELO|nr:unnamed protein product [Caenorhabditis angaria]